MDVLVRGLYQVGFRWKKRKERRKEEEEEEKKKILGGGGDFRYPRMPQGRFFKWVYANIASLKNVPSSKWSGGFLHHAEGNRYECLLFAVNFH